MRNHSIFSLICLATLLSGCGLFTRTEKIPLKGAPYTTIPGSLDAEYFHSPEGDIAGRYPKGWLRVDLTSIPMENVLSVYTDPNRATALVLAELPATAEFRRNVERDGLVALADQSFANKTAHNPGKLLITKPPEIYTINGNLFASYEYGESSGDSLNRKMDRVALFTTGAKFYELSMIELLPPVSPSQHKENFRLLESVIGTLEGVAQVKPISDSLGGS